MEDPIRVAVVDNDKAFCQKLHAWFEITKDIRFVGEAQDGEELMEFVREVQPDVILVNVDVAAFQVSQMSSLTRIIVLHLPGQEPLALEKLFAGALGHLDKRHVQPEQALEAIRAVNCGEAFLSPSMAGWIVDEIARRRLKDEREKKDEQ